MSAKELLDELDAAYHDGRVGARGARVVVGRRAIDNPEVATAYREWIGDGVGSARAAAALRTSYHDRGAEAAAAAGGDRGGGGAAQNHERLVRGGGERRFVITSE